MHTGSANFSQGGGTYEKSIFPARSKLNENKILTFAARKERCVNCNHMASFYDIGLSVDKTEVLVKYRCHCGTEFSFVFSGGHVRRFIEAQKSGELDWDLNRKV